MVRRRSNNCCREFCLYTRYLFTVEFLCASGLYDWPTFQNCTKSRFTTKLCHRSENVVRQSRYFLHQAVRTFSFLEASGLFLGCITARNSGTFSSYLLLAFSRTFPAGDCNPLPTDFKAIPIGLCNIADSRRRTLFAV
jgi:hypothetical protein